MKRLLLLLAILLGSTAAVEAQYPPRRGTAAPTACAVGDIWVDTDALTGVKIYVAEGVGPCVWVLQGDGAGTGIPSGAALPGTCSTGDLFFRTATVIGLYQCMGNVWYRISSPGQFNGGLFLLDAALFSGGDPCIRITNAIAQLTNGDGVIDARGLVGDQTCTGGFTIGRGITVLMGNIHLTVGASIFVEEGGHLIGLGTAPDFYQSTTFIAKNSLNADVVVGRNAAGASQWWHWGTMWNFRVEGNAVNQTSGDCVQVDQIGETALIGRLLLQACKQSGLRLTGIAAGPHKIESLTINDTGTAATDAALNIDGATSTFVIENIKGDGNKRMLRIDSGGDLDVILTKLQGENAVAGNNDPFIYLDENVGGQGVTLTINGLFPPGGVAKTNIILAEGGNPIIKVNHMNLNSSPYTNILTFGSKVVRVRDINGVFTGDAVDWSYKWGTVSNYYGSIAQAVTAANGTNNNLNIGENTHVRITGPTAAFTITGISNGDVPASCTVDCVVDGHMVWLFNTTAQTMSFTHQDAGSTDVFRIITRTGATVNVGPSSVAVLTYSKVDDRWVLWNDDYSTTTDTAGAIVKRDSSGIAKATVFDATTGYRIGAAATTGRCLLGDGTNFIQSSVNCVTTTSTDTLNNKTIDDEGTGNNITRVAEIDIDGAACVSGTAALNWDTPVGTGDTAPTAACNDTGSIQRPSADFSGSAVNSMERTIRLPLGWTGDIDLTVEYVTVAASPTGNVEWDISTVCRAVGESWDAAFNAAQTITDAAGAQNAINAGSQAAITVTGCAAEEHLTIKVSRDGVNDTNNDIAKLLKVYIKLRHTK